jgi:hypothetical protein
MAHPYHHALSSVKKWGGTVDDYLACHEFFDASKLILADFRHRALRHHAEGIFLLEQVHGKTLTLSTGRVIPTRWVGEQHVRRKIWVSSRALPTGRGRSGPSPGWAGPRRSRLRSIRIW